MKTYGACGKAIYSSKDQASRSRMGLADRLRVYFCRSCAGWHLSNADKNSRERANYKARGSRG